ncbi:hypothetical protein HDV57DRAFT_508953 [Trichoderma longibrachiatum]
MMENAGHEQHMMCIREGGARRNRGLCFILLFFNPFRPQLHKALSLLTIFICVLPSALVLVIGPPHCRSGSPLASGAVTSCQVLRWYRLFNKTLP